MIKQITRRGFLTAILGAACAPAIVKANNLMKLSAGGVIIPQNAGELVSMDGQTFIKKLAGDFDGESISIGRGLTKSHFVVDELPWISFPHNPKVITSDPFKIRSIT